MDCVFNVCVFCVCGVMFVFLCGVCVRGVLFMCACCVCVWVSSVCVGCGVVCVWCVWFVCVCEVGVFLV